jgi:GNAT superfamily N-acetyltransferase
MYRKSNDMKKSYIVRPYQSGDDEGLVKLLELVFNGWPHFDLSCTPLDHWRWKFRDNPLKSNIITVALSNNDIIGCHHMVPTRLKLGGRVLLYGNGSDSAVHPDFRGLGIFNELEELRKELAIKNKMEFTFHHSGNPIVIGKRQRRGDPSFPHEVIALSRIRDIDRHLQSIHTDNSWLKRYGFHFLKFINKLNAAPNFLPSQEFTISKIQSFHDNINVFWNETKDHYTFIVERSKDYLNWRYCDPRGGDYIVRMAEADGRVLGFIVLRINRYVEDYPRGYVADLISLPNRFDVVDALVGDAIRFFDELDINTISVQVIREHPYERIFKRYGFLQGSYKISTFYRTLGLLGDELNKFQTSSSERMHFEYGDYDAI